MSTKPIDTALWKNIFGTAALFLVLLAIAIYFSWKFGQLATDPVLKLARAVENYNEQENLDRFNISGPREVDVLTAAIKKYLEESRNHQRHMEQTIAAQTESLRKSQQEIKTILDSFRKLSKHLRLNDAVSVIIDTARTIVYCNVAHLILTVSDENSPPDSVPMNSNRLADEGNENYFSEQNQTAYYLYPKSFSRTDTQLISTDLVDVIINKGDLEIIPSVQNSIYKGKVHPSIRSCAIYPLISGTGKPFGVLFLGMRGDTPLDENECATLRAVMEPIGMVFDNVFLYSQVEKLATHDSLTGLLNHQNCRERLMESIKIAKRQESPVFILMADIDKFKTLNDTYGHPVGDKVIKTFAGIICKSRRVGEYVGRMGGEEFIVILGNTNLEGACAAAERIMKDVRLCEIKIGSHQKAAFRVSMGIAGYPSHAASMDDLIEKADSALYIAKAQGRDRFVVWDESVESQSVKNVSRVDLDCV